MVPLKHDCKISSRTQDNLISKGGSSYGACAIAKSLTLGGGYVWHSDGKQHIFVMRRLRVRGEQGCRFDALFASAA
eukprot:3061169-Amphidinium_carterae.2